MNVTDDSDEDIFDASARPASGCDSISNVIQCAEDETCCEVVQLSRSHNGETCSFDTAAESVMPTDHQDTVHLKCSDFASKCNIGTVVLPPARLLGNELSAYRVDPSMATVHCDDTGQTNDSFANIGTDCVTASNSCLTNTVTTDFDTLQSSRTTQSVDSCASVNSSEIDDELLAELENEFSCTTTPVKTDSLSLDHCSIDGPLSSHVYRLSNDDPTSAYVTLQRRQQALECRLQSTLEARKQLESENARLECKLSASLEALEAAKRDAESAALEVRN